MVKTFKIERNFHSISNLKTVDSLTALTKRLTLLK